MKDPTPVALLKEEDTEYWPFEGDEQKIKAVKVSNYVWVMAWGICGILLVFLKSYFFSKILGALIVAAFFIYYLIQRLFINEPESTDLLLTRKGVRSNGKNGFQLNWSSIESTWVGAERQFLRGISLDLCYLEIRTKPSVGKMPIKIQWIKYYPNDLAKLIKILTSEGRKFETDGRADKIIGFQRAGDGSVDVVKPDSTANFGAKLLDELLIESPRLIVIGVLALLLLITRFFSE